MNTLPLVSVILPVYNVENYLAECLDSVLAQTYENYELIAVNDGSTDSSLELLQSYQDKFGAKLIIVDQPNGGLSAARNSGLERVKGEFVYFLDSDDWILENTLAKCVGVFTDRKSDLVIFNASAFCDGMSENALEKYNYTRDLPNDEYTDGKRAFNDSLFNGTYVVQSCCYMYRFNSFKKLRFIPGILHEDNYFTTMLFLNGSKIDVLKDRFFQRRIRQDSITTSIKTIRHAEGYYATVDALVSELRGIAGSVDALPTYYNQLLREGFKVESELPSESSSFSRKKSLIKRFKGVIDYKSIICLFSPRTFETLVNMKGKL